MQIRKIATYAEETHCEGDQELFTPFKTTIAAAVVDNPWHGKGYVDDLSAEIDEYAPRLAKVLVPVLQQAMGGGEAIAAFGKAGLVGLDGEIEHAAAFIHTLNFGNPLRDMAKGESFLSSTNRRGTAGASVVVPMIHKNERGRRSHFLTAEFSIPDAPKPDEVIVAIAAASPGRPLARIGDRTTDLPM